MKDVWNRIHSWLDENAPAGYGHLRPGATTDDIQAAEKAMGLKLPMDVEASCRVHDGQGNEPGLIGGEGWCLLSLQEMLTLWRKWSEHAPRFRDCVPVAWGSAGDYIFLDLGPNAESPGRAIVQRSDTEGTEPVAPSFRLWLEGFADTLERDEFAYSENESCLVYADELD